MADHYSGYKVFDTDEKLNYFIEGILYGNTNTDAPTDTTFHYSGYKAFSRETSSMIGFKSRYGNG